MDLTIKDWASEFKQFRNTFVKRTIWPIAFSLKGPLHSNIGKKASGITNQLGKHSITMNRESEGGFFSFSFFFFFGFIQSSMKCSPSLIFHAIDGRPIAARPFFFYIQSNGS